MQLYAEVDDGQQRVDTQLDIVVEFVVEGEKHEGVHTHNGEYNAHLKKAHIRDEEEHDRCRDGHKNTGGFYESFTEPGRYKLRVEPQNKTQDGGEHCQQHEVPYEG